MSIKYQGKVSESGVLSIVNRKNFDADILELSGKYVVIEVKARRSTRSDAQNRYYWGCVVPMVRVALKDIGHKLSIEDTHLFLRSRFLKEEMVNDDGEVIGELIKHTSQLTKSQFSDYTEEIKQFSAEYLGLIIPDPNEQISII